MNTEKSINEAKSNAVLPLIIRSLPSYEEMQPIIERIAYEQLAVEQIDDLVAKMNLLRQFIESMVVSGNDEDKVNMGLITKCKRCGGNGIERSMSFLNGV